MKNKPFTNNINENTHMLLWRISYEEFLDKTIVETKKSFDSSEPAVMEWNHQIESFPQRECINIYATWNSNKSRRQQQKQHQHIFYSMVLR